MDDDADANKPRCEPGWAGRGCYATQGEDRLLREVPVNPYPRREDLLADLSNAARTSLSVAVPLPVPPGATPGSTRHQSKKSQLEQYSDWDFLVAGTAFEPATFGLQSRLPTDIGASCIHLIFCLSSILGAPPPSPAASRESSPSYIRGIFAGFLWFFGSALPRSGCRRLPIQPLRNQGSADGPTLREFNRDAFTDRGRGSTSISDSEQRTSQSQSSQPEALQCHEPPHMWQSLEPRSEVCSPRLLGTVNSHLGGLFRHDSRVSKDLRLTGLDGSPFVLSWRG